MDLLYKDEHGVVIQLSRRNLTTLLAKLDGHPPESQATLLRHTDRGRVIVQAVPDEVAYAERTPGAVHPDTQCVLNKAGA